MKDWNLKQLGRSLIMLAMSFYFASFGGLVVILALVTFVIALITFSDWSYKLFFPE